jgi:hypothetical protein
MRQNLRRSAEGEQQIVHGVIIVRRADRCLVRSQPVRHVSPAVAGTGPTVGGRPPDLRELELQTPGDGMLSKMTKRFYDRLYLLSAVVVGMDGGIAIVAGVIAFANSLAA